MPIKPENKSRYPKDWPLIPRWIRDKAGNKCEECDLENHSMVYRCNEKDCNAFVSEDSEPYLVDLFKAKHPDHRLIKIVLTVAHLDHQPENCKEENLKAWCQKCHNDYDMPERIKNRKRSS